MGSAEHPNPAEGGPAGFLRVAPSPCRYRWTAGPGAKFLGLKGRSGRETCKPLLGGFNFPLADEEEKPPGHSSLPGAGREWLLGRERGDSKQAARCVAARSRAKEEEEELVR